MKTKLRLVVTITFAIGAFVVLMAGLLMFLRPAFISLLDQGGLFDRILFASVLGCLALVIGQSMADAVLALIFDHHHQKE